MNQKEVIEELRSHITHEKREIENQRKFLNYIQCSKICSVGLIQAIQTSIHYQKNIITRINSILELVGEKMNKKQKAKNKVDLLIQKAKLEAAKKGYRENLGYDSFAKLESDSNFFNLNYADKCDVIEYFYSECDKI